MSLAFRKTFAAKPPAPVLRPHAIEAPRQHQHQHRSSSSPSSSLPSYAAASSSPSRGYFGPAPEVNRQGSIGTATREFGRSNKPQPVPAEGLVPRRSHVGAGAVGTSPPLPAIPLPPSKYEGAVRQTFAPPIDGLGIALDLSPTQTRNRTPSPNSSPASQDTLEFPILANVSHVRSSPVAAVSFKPVPAPLDSRSHVEPLRLESSRDRLVRTRASISAPSDYTSALPKSRGGNRSDPTKCYTMAVAPSFDIALVRPPKSTLRGLKPLPATLPDEQSLSDPTPSAAAPAWTSRSAPSSRKNSSAVVAIVTAPSATPAGMYCLRPTVHASTQTPDWFSSLPSSSRRISSSTPPQAYSSFNGMFGAPVQEAQHDITQPSPSVYSISSFDGRSRAHGHHNDRRASRSSFYAATEQIREGDEDLQDVIDRHLGELENGIDGDQHRQASPEEMETLEVNYDLPFLSATAYDTPQLRPFEIPPTPLALPPLNHSEGLVPSPALTAGAVTPRFDRTPTLPSLSIGVPSSASSRSITPNQAYSPSSSTSHDSSEPFTPPTSATCSTFDDVSIQLAEQEPIEIRRASLVPSSSRKASLVTTASSYSSSSAPSSRPPSLHYSESSSSLSTKSVKFDIVEQQQRPSVSIIPVSSGSSSSSSSSNSSPLSINLYPSASNELDSTPEEEDHLLTASQARRRCSESAIAIPRQSNMSREERAAKGRSYFLVQALLGEGLPSEGLIRDWARDSDDEGSDDEGSIADSEL